MVTVLAAVALSTTLLLLLVLLLLKSGQKPEGDMAKTLVDLLPPAVSTFFTRVGRLVIGLSKPRVTLSSDRRETRVGARLRLIGALLPKGDEWRLEELMDHRNEMRLQEGRVPRFHYLRVFLGVCTIRWETWRDPQRRVD
ncbi:hypothetical protein OG288_17950 [Streptomyces tauricus]|uniref:Uncharacterized protein n=1 Tax=Streptomyces tauricus TaxID=68274 RepID=A0ABZ1JEI7_9ACTN|nr:hypothetical protein [Streptomyces tauricus]